MFKEPRIKKKRYGSLSAIQEKGISEADRRLRVRAKKRVKKKGKSEEASELEGRSISDSDMKARRNFLLAEAIKTIEVGKTIGIEFIGDENEVVKDLIALEGEDQEIKAL
ncbi:hypothetical protein V6N11_068683 [Hibiscus sabdariffa]|uniref:Uncharacterized protein n=1 Tax=Hibiscus sabdariffa TaxID=183260 RepID=A0ABR2PAT6_9ROSI